MNSPFRFTKRVRVILFMSNCIFLCGGISALILNSPEDQYAAKLRIIEILQCEPPHVFTSCAFVMDLSTKTAWVVILDILIPLMIVPMFYLPALAGRAVGWVIMMDIMIPVMVTPIFYFPALAGCSIGWFQSMGLPVILQLTSGALSFSNVANSIFLLFEYRHHIVLPKSSPFRFRKSILQCEPPHIFTSCAFVVDLTSRAVSFVLFVTVAFTTQILFFGTHVLHILNSQSSHMSNRTRQLQKTFFYNLCAQLAYCDKRSAKSCLTVFCHHGNIPRRRFFNFHDFIK
ncbi:unnamed protein product [Caenorhabditis auriculariae]|uniref:Uncharacterized protein n=1 Tax=Caenorhabditis auriculariae TaxID=2777116 RepID=A0A8S1H025_9PELO|nr:unnamed protein product [Caenorhabditis auriculariae]